MRDFIIAKGWRGVKEREKNGDERKE